MENETVVKFCGEYPENFIKQDIASNPDFVFKNDPTYQTVQLFDIEDNTVYVNSFIECEHYVAGGWDQNTVQRQETNMQLIIVGVIIFFIVAKFIYSRFNLSLFGN